MAPEELDHWRQYPETRSFEKLVTAQAANAKEAVIIAVGKEDFVTARACSAYLSAMEQILTMMRPLEPVEDEPHDEFVDDAVRAF